MTNTKTLSYKLTDIMEILDISRTHAYDFVNEKNNPPFPVLHIGRSIRIPKDSFDAWFNGRLDKYINVQPISKVS